MTELTREQLMLMEDLTSGRHEQRAIMFRRGKALPGDQPHLDPVTEARVRRELVEAGLLTHRTDGTATLVLTDAGTEAWKARKK